ncbi:MAG: nucleotide exchange factor GrpE [Gammaproteobacteria bacterium]|nr:nucleotide exchange factor GrpE [Gammaproteobacteria bacterium]
MTESSATPSAAPEASSTSVSIEEYEALNARLTEAEAAASTARDAQLRALAEVDNVRKRAEREIDSARKFGTERVLGDLLAINDSLELGIKAAGSPEATVASIGEGMTLTHGQLLKFFDKHGISIVDPAGQPFNPDLHEAVSAVPSADVAPNYVISVLQKGYRLHERLLRPAMVIVAKAP